MVASDFLNYLHDIFLIIINLAVVNYLVADEFGPVLDFFGNFPYVITQYADRDDLNASKSQYEQHNRGYAPGAGRVYKKV